MMKDLSVTQQYLLCVLGKRGKFATFEIEKMMCLSTAGLLELLLDGIVELEDKKLFNLQLYRTEAACKVPESDRVLFCDIYGHKYQ